VGLATAPPSSAEANEGVELYFYCPLSLNGLYRVSFTPYFLLRVRQNSNRVTERTGCHNNEVPVGLCIGTPFTLDEFFMVFLSPFILMLDYRLK
jgi:hypothetical protein